MSINRRTFVVTGLAASALAPRLAMAQDAIQALYEAAKSEGEITWYVVPLASESAEIVGQKFTELFPVRRRVWRSSGLIRTSIQALPTAMC